MADKIIENNQVSIVGEIVSDFMFSHEVFGEVFYMVDVSIKRLSASADRIPVMISERLIDVTQDYKGEFIQVTGQFRSYNRHEEKKNRLVLSVFAREVTFVEEEDDKVKSAIDIIKKECSTRKRVIVNTPYIGNGLSTSYVGVPVNVEVGGATIFVMDVEEFYKI